MGWLTDKNVTSNMSVTERWMLEASLTKENLITKNHAGFCEVSTFTMVHNGVSYHVQKWDGAVEQIDKIRG